MAGRILLQFLVTALLACLADAVYAQSSIVSRLDANKDGKVDPKELTGFSARMYERLVQKYKLDKEKVYTIEELQKAMGVEPTTSSSGSSPSTGSSRPRSFSRGISRSRSSRSFGSRRSSSGKKYRTLIKLPGDYARYDNDGDGQVGLYEWPRDRIRDFLELDKNDDGFITLKEVSKPQRPSERTSESSRESGDGE